MLFASHQLPFVCLQLAHALVEHETLDAEEVRKVIRGEPIRNIKEKISHDEVAEVASEEIPALT